MPNTVQAAAEGLPEITRRRLLLGLAAASTAAAAVTIEASAASSENPELIALSAQLPAIADAYQVARRASDDVGEYWRSQARAPDELTVPGAEHPLSENVKQTRDIERTVIGGYLWRAGEKFPRRIVVTSWNVRAQIGHARRKLRKARKEGRLADCLVIEDETVRLEKLERIAAEYEREHHKVSKKAQANFRKFWPVAHARLEDLEKHIAAIMDTPDWTMEGLVIKAQALATWDSIGGHAMDKVAFRHGKNWHGQIAASILRHAKGGAA